MIETSPSHPLPSLYMLKIWVKKKKNTLKCIHTSGDEQSMSFILYVLVGPFFQKRNKEPVASPPTSGSELHTSLEHHRRTQTMEFSRCSEHSVLRAASMRSQASAPEELPGRREKGRLENQEAALGVAGLAAVPAPLATAPCRPTELSP